MAAFIPHAQPGFMTEQERHNALFLHPHFNIYPEKAKARKEEFIQKFGQLEIRMTLIESMFRILEALGHPTSDVLGTVVLMASLEKPNILQCLAAMKAQRLAVDVDTGSSNNTGNAAATGGAEPENWEVVESVNQADMVADMLRTRTIWYELD